MAIRDDDGPVAWKHKFKVVFLKAKFCIDFPNIQHTYTAVRHTGVKQ